MSQLLTPDGLKFHKGLLQHPEQQKLISDLKQRKYYHTTIVAGRRSFKTERFGKRYLVQQAIHNDNQKFFAGLR